LYQLCSDKLPQAWAKRDGHSGLRTHSQPLTPVVESGGVEVAWTPESLKSMIVQNLAKPQVRSAQRRALLKQMFGDTLDGMSSRRVAEQLIRLGAVKRSR